MRGFGEPVKNSDKNRKPVLSASVFVRLFAFFVCKNVRFDEIDVHIPAEIKRFLCVRRPQTDEKSGIVEQLDGFRIDALVVHIDVEAVVETAVNVRVVTAAGEHDLEVREHFVCADKIVEIKGLKLAHTEFVNFLRHRERLMDHLIRERSLELDEADHMSVAADFQIPAECAEINFRIGEAVAQRFGGKLFVRGRSDLQFRSVRKDRRTVVIDHKNAVRCGTDVRFNAAGAVLHCLQKRFFGIFLILPAVSAVCDKTSGHSFSNSFPKRYTVVLIIADCCGKINLLHEKSCRQTPVSSFLIFPLFCAIITVSNHMFQRSFSMKDELTSADIQKMKEEIEYRQAVLTPKFKEEVARTRALGDLSENDEYRSAKRELNRNYSRIRYLKAMIETAVVIEIEESDAETVGLFDHVTIWYEDDEEERTITIVTTLRNDVLNGLISKESPLGKALLGKKIGERVKIDVNDNYSYYVEIRDLEKGADDASLNIN